MLICEPGDILLYTRNPTLIDDAIEAGEWLEDGYHKRVYYHVGKMCVLF